MCVNTELPTKFYIITYLKKTKCIIGILYELFEIKN